ncbi:MAG: aminomethyl-transferring glycine dehydrogenase subunit GcvPA [Dehalococcoidia bacterium]
MEDRTFLSPYSPNTEEDRSAMLRAVGVASIEELFSDIPEAYRDPWLNLPPPLSELELGRELEARATQNVDTKRYACFLGAGAYNHFIPSVVRHLMGRGEFMTAYTPYQAEASQGTLQVAYEFQTLVCQLFGMEVANAGMYDGATALAEAALMACRVTGRGQVVVLDTVSPTYREVLTTYATPQGIEVVTQSPGRVQLTSETACLLVQHPNFYGYLEELAPLEQVAHGQGALLAVSTDPIAMGMFHPPGDYNADIVTAEGQPLGIPLSFGGPYVGLFATREKFLRQMPGRIVGRTTDAQGRTGYVLTLQTREQHIRRERATSNICTSQALVALAATIYGATMGKQGLQRIAELCYHKAHYAASLISRTPGYSLPLGGTFFREFVVQCPAPPSEINRRLLERGIIGGLDIGGQVASSMLLCVTELNTRGEIEALAQALAEFSRS